jgi:hypothetical protein
MTGYEQCSTANGRWHVETVLQQNSENTRKENVEFSFYLDASGQPKIDVRNFGIFTGGRGCPPTSSVSRERFEEGADTRDVWSAKTLSDAVAHVREQFANGFACLVLLEDLIFAEHSQLLAKEEVFCSQSSARMGHEDSQMEQINRNWHDRSEAVGNGSEER